MSSLASVIDVSTDLLNVTQLHGWHCRKGAKMVPFAGYDMPLQYPLGIISEHHHTRQKAGLFDVSHMGVIKVMDDPEHVWVLERVIPTDIKEMLPGQMKYGLLLNEEGYIMDDLIISRYDKYFLLVVNAGCKHQDYDYLRRFLVCEMLEDVALLALQGPKARTVMVDLCPEAAQLTFMTTAFYFLDHELWISCSGYTGEDGFEIILPKAACEKLADKLCAHPDVMPVGLGARDSLRLEAGLCLYGHDMDATQTPVSASLVWSIGQRRRREGDFVGDEMILAQLQGGTPMKRVGLKGLSKAIAREGASVYDQAGEKVGHVTSGIPSPTLGYPIAMAYVASALSKVDTTLEVEIRGQKHPFTVTKMPFHQQNYYRG